MIVVLPFNDADKAQAERLLDCIYWHGGQKPFGHLLLVSAPDVHPEFRLKVRLAGEVAFETVDMMELGKMEGGTKLQQINSVFKQTARYIKDSYKESWLWLESDCVPLSPTWISDLDKAYRNQPRRYMGRHMRGKDKVFLSRVSVYPANAIDDLETYCAGPAPFERVAGILPRSSMTTLIHIDKVFKPEMALPVGVSLLNQDKSGLIVDRLIEESAPVRLARPRGRPRKIIA